MVQLLERAPDPDAARAGWRRFAAAAPGAVRQALHADPTLAEALLALLGHSEFLAETLVQSPELLLWLDESRRETSGRARDRWTQALADFTAALPAAERSAGLARFKRREYLRIVLRDLQGQATLAETTEELSRLADALLAQAYAWAWNELAGRFGTPRGRHGEGAELAVLGLGKLGGLELNYSSDIDLMFLYNVGGETSGGAEVTSNREFFTRMAQAITQYVSGVTAEGSAYRVDLRLRPGGREGELALALDGALHYYIHQARDWELQMLIRARACAGSWRLAQQFLEAVQTRVYPAAPDTGAVAEGVRLSRQRISAQLERHRALGRRRPELDVKLDAGGIRDIEFLVQYLQRLHGGAEPWVRTGNTMFALQRLQDKRRLGAGEYQRLSAAYWLLRQVEHRLQLRLGQQTHTLPTQTERLWSLARSLAWAEGGRLATAVGAELSEMAVQGAGPEALAAALLHELNARMSGVREIYDGYLGPEAAALSVPRAAAGATPAVIEHEGEHDRWPGEEKLSRHGQRQWRRLLRSAATLPESEAALRQLTPAALPRLALALEASDWMAETLIRQPQLLAMLNPGATAEPWPGGEFSAGMAHLRRWRQQRTLQLILQEWYEAREQAAPIATTLSRYTALAEEILEAALALARPAAAPVESFVVGGVGRVGRGGQDLLTALDMVFLPREAQREPANRLAAKFIEVLTAYTQQGGLYAVDTRLRPGGREGELVQTPASVEAHFQRTAGAWEALSYLKARVVAGDGRTGQEVLQALAATLAARFSGRGTDHEAMGAALAALRLRMQKAGRPGRWGLKTPPGGYYDVDFLVSRRWLGAGRLPPPAAGLAGTARALAPELLPPATAGELAALTEFLRAADHALRVASGKAGSDIPAAGEVITRASAWLERIQPLAWPGHRVDAGRGGERDLAAAVAAACARIHELYEQWP